MDKRKHIIAGIDVGKKGAIAIIDGDKVLDTYRFKMQNGQAETFGYVLDARDMMDWLTTKPFFVNHAFIENMGIQPAHGLKTAACLHCILGGVMALLSNMSIKYSFVRPPKWKKYYDLIGKKKRASCDRAMELFPEIGHIKVKDADIAEAILIANYGYRRHFNEFCTTNNGRNCI